MARPGPKPTGNALTPAEKQRRYRERLKEKQQQQPEIVMSLKTELSGLKEALNAGNQELARLDDENQRLRLELARLRQDQADQDKPKTRTRAKKKPVT